MRKWLASSVAAVVVILCSQVAATGQDVPQEWKSLDVPGLTALAKQLASRSDAAAKAERERLAAHVAQRYAADAAGGRINHDQWLDLQALLGSAFPDPTKAAMAEGITKNLVPRFPVDAAALNDTSGEQAVLFSMPWLNPTPDVEIASVDLVYGEPGSQYGTPALLAITAGRAMK